MFKKLEEAEAFKEQRYYLSLAANILSLTDEYEDAESYEEIEKSAKEFLEDSFDINKMANHSPRYVNEYYNIDIDLTPFLEKINEDFRENKMVITIDTKTREVKSEIVARGSSYDVYGINEFMEFISKNVDIDTLVVIAHNHPNTIAAIPSENDLNMFAIERFLIRTLAGQLVDEYVVSDFDIYSQHQAEESGKSEKIIETTILTAEQREQLKKMGRKISALSILTM